MSKLIESGWVSMVAAAYPHGMLPDQEDQLRVAFYAGAFHLFTLVTTGLSPGPEVADADLRRMDAIEDELRAFISDFKRIHGIEIAEPK